MSIDEEISLQGNRMVVSGIIYHEREQTSSNKAKSPVKRKSKFTNCGSRENQKRKMFLCDNFDGDEKEQLKKVDKKITKCVITQRKKKKEYSQKEDNKKKKKDSMITLTIIKKNS